MTHTVYVNKIKVFHEKSLIYFIPVKICTFFVFVLVQRIKINVKAIESWKKQWQKGKHSILEYSSLSNFEAREITLKKYTNWNNFDKGKE
jgi:hypothetical protein